MSSTIESPYKDPVKEDDYVLTVGEFMESCEVGAFIDYDGFGYPVKDGMANSNIWVYPSERETVIPEDATHIVWFNR